jgi:hypothetical protein
MKFREAQAEIEQLVEKSRTGETNLAYVDEAGFAQAQPNRTAWTEKGEVHLITAERGKRLNVLGALISNGTLFTAKFWETTTAAAFGGFLGLLLECSGKPLTVILDNASIHKFYFATFLKWLKYRLLSYISNALPHKEYDDEIAKFIYLGSGVRWPAAARI